ncbi:MAG TPA: lipoyl domain-containing protein [Steroidobacteraceae bacterium]|nr:lipoyl domain-containing protein [Steroidobacteraceae bacterium]
MAFEVLLPKLDFAMAEGTVSEWFAQDGATVKAGAPLYALETGKAVQEVEAPASGTLKILVPVGEAYPVGTVLATIE